MTEIVQHVIDAISVGSLYALIALGIALVFGVVRVVNFAHGEFIMVGAYLILLSSSLGWPLVVAICIAGVALLAVISERLVFRPLRFSDPTTLLVGSLAVSIFLQNGAILTEGSRAKGVGFGSGLNSSIEILGLRLQKLDLLVIAMTAVLLVGLLGFLRRTSMGVQLRAAAEDFDMARLLGVWSTRVILVAFAIGGALAGVASLFVTIQTGTLTPSMGLQPVLIGLVASVLGGLGNLGGAILGGFVMGALTVLLQVALPDAMLPYRDALVFTVVIAMLLFRPQGLMRNSAMAERV